MKAEIYWIKDIDPYRVATMPRPCPPWRNSPSNNSPWGKTTSLSNWLSEEINSLREQGVDVLVSLLTPEEVLYMDLEMEPDNCQSCGIEFISFPITDRETPRSETATREFVRRLAELVKAGKGVAIHCYAGVGRSSLIAGCVLVNLGVDPQTVFDLIGKSRGCGVPDTPQQREWFYSFVSSIL